MARAMTVGAGSKSGGRQEENGNEPPPSTLAAQIVQQQTRAPQGQGQAVFLQLLEEIKASPAALEDDVDSNYKLISVVLEAGLNAFAADELIFSRDSTAVSHAIACLEVIEIAFRRNPSVLFHTSTDIADAVESPLCLLLIPKLFQLWKYSSISQLRIQLENTLLAFASTLYKVRGGKANAKKLERLYKTCTDDLHRALSIIANDTGPNSTFTLQVPSAHARELVVADDHQRLAVKRPWQANLTDPVQIASIEISMLSILARINVDSRAATNQTNNNWIVGKLLQCRAALAYLHKTASRDRMARLDIQLIITICDLLRIMDAQAMCSTLVEKTYLMLVRHISTILERITIHTTDELTSEAPLVFSHLESGVVQHERVAEQTRMLLSPYFQVLEGRSERLSNLLRATTSRETATADVEMIEATTKDEIDERTTERPHKRRKVVAASGDSSPDWQHEYQSLCDEFQVQDADTDTVCATVLHSLKQDKDEQRLQKRLVALARLPCAGAKTALDSERIRCGLCQRSTLSSYWDESLWESFSGIISGLTAAQDLHWSKDARVLLMAVVRSFAYHTTFPEQLSMTESSIGISLLTSMVGSSREIRLAAVNALPPFLLMRPGHDDSTFRHNRFMILDALRVMLDGNETRKWETTIKALGTVANCCDDTGVNIVLLRLVDCLGSTNSLACSLAQLELRNLAQSTSGRIDDLLRPFWRTIAVSVAKDLHSRPQKAQQLVDLLGISVDDFLLGSQEIILPYLIMWRRSDILQRMATSQGSSIRHMCMDKRNLTAILASLLIQDPDHPEAAIQGFLVQATPEFRKVSVSDLLRSDIVAITCELLKLASEADERDQEKISNALLRFARTVDIDAKSGKETASQAKTKPSFFEKHALGMMTNFTQVIDNPQQPTIERLRYIKAIKLMIELAQSEIAAALPQIRACLQSALQSPALKEQAFLTWLSLLKALDNKNEDHLASILEQTFTILCNNWEEVSATLQQQAHSVIHGLLKDHNQLFLDSVLLIPSLQSIPLMSKLDSGLARHREKADTADRLHAFNLRCRNENAAVRLQALKELFPFLAQHQGWLHDSVMSEQPQPAIAELVRTLLDISTNTEELEVEVLDLCAQCLGVIGCFDPVRLEATRESRDLIVLSNFETSQEAVKFVILLLETVLVKAFHSAPNPRAQGFLAYVMQELLKFCGFKMEICTKTRPLDEIDDVHRYWFSMTESAQTTLRPLLTSRYVLTVRPDTNEQQSYPIYDGKITHREWLHTFVYDLLRKASGDNAKMIFRVLSRIIRGYDVSISSFLLPFVVTNVIIGGTVQEIADVGHELSQVLEQPGPDAETARLCSENVFQVLDYLSKWSQGKRKLVMAKDAASNTHTYNELDQEIDTAQISSVETVLFDCVPADIIATRAVECGSYARALFHWEQYIRQQREPERLRSMKPQDVMQEREMQYHRLHTIYAEIDEPDGIEGISHFIQVFEPEEQILEHEKHDRWSAAQSWYESYVNEDPTSLDNHLDLMTCLQRAGQHVMVIDHGRNCLEDWPDNEHLLSLMSESSWSAKKLSDLRDLLLEYKPAEDLAIPLNIGIGKVLVEEMSTIVEPRTSSLLRELRLSVMRTLSPAATASLQSCHDQMLKLHTLYEIDLLSSMHPTTAPDLKAKLHATLSQRLEIVGSYSPDKQHLLSIRRAVMDTKPKVFDDDDKSQLWLQSARLARKDNRSEIAYNAVLNALQLGDESAKIEQARLLWKTGEHRKAIQSLEGAIESNAFIARNVQDTGSMQALNATAATGTNGQEQNLLVAKANLLLAKWLDRAGQTSTNDINIKYQHAVKSFARWEKGLYHLGKFYNKLLETIRTLPPQKQDGTYIYGDCAKLVIENYLRSLVFGCKYLHETMPKLLTLWLDFGIEIQKAIPREVPDDVRARAATRRPEVLDAMNKQVRKYSDKIAPYLFYPALAQMITRVCHPHAKVYDVLSHIIVKVVIAYPRQALWPLLATAKSSAHDRATRGVGLLNKLREKANKTVRHESQSIDFRDIISKGQKLSEQLLMACDTPLGDRTTGVISLTKDLRFNYKAVGQCPLVVPVDKMLAVNLPTVATDYYGMKSHKAFPSSLDAVTIQSFTDDVLVLNSLQKPRKLTVRASDGRKYGLLCKPKDDLRKDQRLMEYNAMVNRALKRDAECTRRRLYIRTYAVTPLNEECGIIEWVDGLKALRDIILQLYRSKGVAVNYGLLKELLNEACSKPENHNIFTNQILGMYPAVLHEWFTDTFSDPESWFSARIRYTRSAAVASIVGHSLGLGDRHGENVMLEEGSGGVFHVDFNCLFEKGLTFEKPELVPFRLTHNMVDAFGAYGVEGPFRRSAECTAKVMRSSEDALLTILETFVYDPTADFMGHGGRRRYTRGVPESPKEILESVGGKLRGLLRGENVPLSVEGHVDALIRQATDPGNLCSMYIGWLSFF